MSKLSTVSRVWEETGTSPVSPGVILFSLFLPIALLVAGCGNKGDLYRESDAAAIEGLQEAADKLRNQADEADPDKLNDEALNGETGEDDETGKKPVKKSNTNTTPGS